MKKYQTIIVCVVMLGVLLVTTVQLTSDYSRSESNYETTYGEFTSNYGLSEENVALLNSIDPYLLSSGLVNLTYTEDFYNIMFDLENLYNEKLEEEAQANLSVLKEWGITPSFGFDEVSTFAFSAIEDDYADEYGLSVYDFLNFTDEAFVFLESESQLLNEVLASSDVNFAYFYLYSSMYYTYLNSDISPNTYARVYDYIFAYTAIEITGSFDKEEINAIVAKYNDIIVYDSIQMATTITAYTESETTTMVDGATFETTTPVATTVTTYTESETTTLVPTTIY